MLKLSTGLKTKKKPIQTRLLIKGQIPMTNEFLREVDEHMHAERMETLWKKHKLHIFGAVGLLFASVIGVKGYSNYTEVQLQKEAATYWQSVSGTELNTESLKSLEETSASGFGMLASFKLGEEALNAGDYETAAGVFASIQGKGLPQEFKELAKFYEATATRYTNIPAAQALYVELSAVGGTYRVSSLEALADIAMTEGKTSEAFDYFQAIVNSGDDLASPNALQRATTQLTILREEAGL
mgnify:CR=1 FL=1